jgi:O-antigen ligase
LLPALAAGWGFLCAAPDLLPWEPLASGYAIGLALLIVAAYEARETRTGPPAAVKALLLFAGFVGLSTVWSQDRAATWQVGSHVAAEVGLLAVLVATPRREAVARGMVFGVVAAAVCLGSAFWWALFFDGAHGRRLHLWGGDGNHQARAVLLGLLLWLGVLRGPKPALLAGFLAMAGGLAGSRGAVLAGLVGLLVIARWPTKGARPAAILAMFGLMLGLFLPAARGDLRSPVEGIAEGNTKTLTSGRDAIWPNVIDIVRDHPVLGVGAGAIPAVYSPYAEAREQRGGAHSKPGRDAHNQYLEVLGSLGPAGLALFLLALWLAANAAIEAEGALAVLAFACVSALTVTSWQQKGWWLALMLPVLLAISRPRPGPTRSPPAGAPR